MCIWELEEFRKANRGELHKGCLQGYLGKARLLIESAEKNETYVSRVDMEPYREAGFNALQDFAKETLKMLMVANGGGAVAILTLGGRLGENPTKLPEFLYWPLGLLVAGTVCVVLAASSAMFSQKYFNKPIKAKKNDENIAKVAYYLCHAHFFQTISKNFAAISALFFILGVLVGLYKV